MLFLSFFDFIPTILSSPSLSSRAPHRCHLEPPQTCHVEPVETSLLVIPSLPRDLSSPPLSSRACREIFFYLSFSRSLREKDQKRGATPKAPYIGGCKRESRTPDDSRAFLVSRDTRYSFLHPCCRRPLERDSQVRDVLHGVSVQSEQSVFAPSPRTCEERGFDESNPSRWFPKCENRADF